MIPGLLVVAPTVLASFLVGDATLATLTARYALLVYGGGVLLAAVFHRSRVVVALTALAFLALAVPSEGDLFVALGTAHAALFGALALTRDRGARSRGGLLQFLLSAATISLVAALLQDPVALDAFGEVRLLPGGLSAWARTPDATLVVGAISLLLGALAVFRWNGPVERGLLWAQGLILVAVHPAAGTRQASLLMMGAGVVLSLSILEQSYFMAYRDELTGLPARRALMRDLAEVGGTYTVAMVDVDHFKKFNDDHGHDVGDQVLQLVATRLSASSDARAYRYGGEEFTLLFARKTREDAMAGAEAVRAAVEEATFSLRSWKRPRKRPSRPKPKKSKKRPRALSVTVSIGLADSAGADTSPEAILKKADQALYRAKKDGRNRVSL